MEPDELEMQIARAVLAEEHVQEQQHTIDALVAALVALASETRSACDARRFPSLTVALSEADAALALARGEG